MNELHVNGIYPEYRIRQDLMSLVIGKDGTFQLFVLLRSPTPKEIENYIPGAPFEIRAGEVEGMLVFAVRTGASPWGDSYYHPIMGGNWQHPGNVLQLMLFDSNTGRLCTLRLIGLRPEFSTAVRNICAHLNDSHSVRSISETDLRRTRLMNLYTTNQLRDRTTARCKVTGGQADAEVFERAGIDTNKTPELPDELKPRYVYMSDRGHCVMCVIAQFIDKARTSGSYEPYTVSLPVRFVLEKGWKLENGWPVVEVPYDEFLGAQVPETYSDY